MGRQYYKSDTHREGSGIFIYMRYYEDETGSVVEGAWANFCETLDVIAEIKKDDDEYDDKMYVINGVETERFVSIDEDWRHNLIERLVCIRIEHIEKLIADIGIRNAFKLANDTGLCEDMTLEDLTTDLGMRKIFYCLLDEHLTINVQFEDATEDEWFDFIETGENYWSGDEDSEDDDEIVPITDEALDRIGGKVAVCA